MKYLFMVLLVFAGFSCRQSNEELSNKSEDLFDAPPPEVSKANKEALLQFLNEKANELEISIKKNPDSLELQTKLAFIREREKVLQVVK